MFTLAVSLVFASLTNPDMRQIERDYFRVFRTHAECQEFFENEVHSDPRGRDVIGVRRHSLMNFLSLCEPGVRLEVHPIIPPGR